MFESNVTRCVKLRQCSAWRMESEEECRKRKYGGGGGAQTLRSVDSLFSPEYRTFTHFSADLFHFFVVLDGRVVPAKM